MNTTKLIFLILLALGAIWFAWRVFMTSSMVRSAMSLLASMTLTGFLFLALEAEFLGILQIMMMATEMSVMAVFMMMYMMDPGGMSGMDMSHQKKPSTAVALLVAALMALVVFFTDWGPAATGAPLPEEQNRQLGMEIMKRSMMIFESAGVAILVAMIASAAVAIKYKKPAQKWK